MRKILCAFFALVMLCAMCGCSKSSELPKGHATFIYYAGGVNQDVDFEYVTETTVKVTYSNGTYAYIPLSQIESIVIQNETVSSK